MSEYQYYEFRAVDRPLNEKQMDELRELSTRAEITSTSLTNEYSYGNFRGDPKKLMEKYFDAFLYVANWGTHRLMFRLPLAWLDWATIVPYGTVEGFSAWKKDESLILELLSQEEGGRWEQGEGQLEELLPLRAELGAGDLRGLYIGWLASIQMAWREDIEDEALEPPVPPGLRELSKPQKALVEFLRVDADLLEVAAEMSPPLSGPKAQPRDTRGWLASLSETEKNEVLLGLLAGEGQTLGMTLQRRFRDWEANQRGPEKLKQDGAPRRRIADLLSAWENHEEETRKREEEQKAKEEAEHAKKVAAARAKYLDDLAPRAAATWQHVEKLIETKKTKEYEQAVKLLVDLRDLGERLKHAEETAKRIRELRARHTSKSSLKKLLDKYGLPR